MQVIMLLPEASEIWQIFVCKPCRCPAALNWTELNRTELDRTELPPHDGVIRMKQCKFSCCTAPLIVAGAADLGLWRTWLAAVEARACFDRSCNSPGRPVEGAVPYTQTPTGSSPLPPQLLWLTPVLHMWRKKVDWLLNFRPLFSFPFFSFFLTVERHWSSPWHAAAALLGGELPSPLRSPRLDCLLYCRPRWSRGTSPGGESERGTREALHAALGRRPPPCAVCTLWVAPQTDSDDMFVIQRLFFFLLLLWIRVSTQSTVTELCN